MLSKIQHPTRAVFYICEQQWLQHHWGANKIGFILQHLIVLHKELAKLNIELDIEYCDLFTDLPTRLLSYIQKHQASNLYFNLEYELNETIRDQQVKQLLANNNIAVSTHHDQCLIPPGQILSKQNTPYTIFTPFKKTCYQYLFNNKLPIFTQLKPQFNPHFTKELSPFLKPQLSKYLDNPVLQQWQTGQQAASNILQTFCSDNIMQYQIARDFPATHATSTLSPYLAIGAISAQQCLQAAISQNHDEFASGNSGVMCWVSELLWRDFYRNIIFHFSAICKGQNFNSKYNKIKWLNPSPNLLKWQNGQTGIPIIDAAMRQLVTTGWMHNRLRMIVAMFLTKNLLIDWRHGEKFFSQHLVDLDFASNNGGWQWSASTGTDAAPYFRIFNPITQSFRFDPDGIFIKQYCPELASLNAKQIHDPSANLDDMQLALLNYPPIMVDLNKSRIRAIECFKRA
jgi:deoxyribodipyrimidine photo-lyase